MTTCAWDGKSLAADSRGTSAGCPFINTKAYRLKDGRLYAGSGDAQDCTAVRLWLESGGEKPTVKDFVAMVIGADGSIWRYEDKLVPFQINQPFHAIGSGRDYALAAMHMGKTAREAVELACVYDVYTGPPITELVIQHSMHQSAQADNQ